MPMNRTRFHRLIPLLLLMTVSLAVFVAVADDQATEPAPTVTPSETPEQTPPQQGDADPGTSEAAETAPATSAAKPTPIKEFTPTDKIEADSAVSFPIDI